MSKTKKYILIGVGIVVVAGGTFFGLKYRERGVITVQSGKVAKVEQLVQTVTATGEIKPLKYVNITATSFGRIIEIPVKEGDRVQKGQLLLRQEAAQQVAQLNSVQASLQQSIDNAAGMDAACGSAKATFEASQSELNRVKAEFDKAQLDFNRYEGLYKEGIFSKAQFDQARASLEVARATVESSKSRVLQAQAELNRADKMHIASKSSVNQQKALVAQIQDQVDKTQYLAPLNAVVTNLPVRAGESAVVGIQNAPGSGLMILADLSVITAEVRVDETDINNVKLDQEAEITVDAIPNKTFKGKVTEVGTTALTRSGQAAGTSNTSTTSQEAKDFKVVVTITNPSDELRPGLSTTAKITTAIRGNVLAIPIQALTIREVDQDKDAKKVATSSPTTAQAATAKDASSAAKQGNPASSAEKKKKKEEQGVFIIKNGVAKFVPVKTGITGQTEIEVASGLKEGDEIITGSYKTLRTIQTDAKVKVDNKAAGKDDQKETK
jgi:HlyD family secretion protein